MAHFAQLDENNIVTQVIVVPDSEEHRGIDFIVNDLGLDGTWIQTSITNRIRKVYGYPGYEYLPELDVFKPNKPEQNPSFVFDEETWTWINPVPKPEDGKHYIWDESSTSWVELILPPPPPLDTGTVHTFDPETKQWIDTGITFEDFQKQSLE
jgi:hypothetical protein